MMTHNTAPPPGSVLIIENDNALREVLVELLDFSDVSSLNTPDGLEGIRLFEHYQNSIDLVVMDMGLPDKSGDVVVKELEAIRPDVKVIIISGQDKKKLDLQFAAQPNITVVQKPFDTFGFLDIVSKRLLS